MILERSIFEIRATAIFSFLATVILFAGCGGGASSTQGNIAAPPAPTPVNIQGQWQVIAHSTVNPASSVLIETNFTQTGANLVASKPSVVLIQGIPGAFTGLGGECDNGSLGNDSIQATISNQTQVSFTLTEAGSLGTGSSTGTATISPDGTQITSGTYSTAAACGFVADNGSVMGALVKPFSGTYAGMLLNGAITDAVTVTVSQSNYALSVVGTDNGTQFTLTGTVVGATFDVTGVIAGRSVEYVGIYEPASNDFRVYDTSFAFLGVLSAQIAPPTPSPISIAVSPLTASVQVGQGQNFTATVTNDTQNKGVTWALSGAGCSATGASCGTLSGTAGASGAAVTYTAPASVPTPPTVKLTATSIADGTKSAAAVITLSAPAPAIVVTVSPLASSVLTSGTQSFTATLQNDSQNKGVSWTLSGAGCTGNSCGVVSPTSSLTGVAIMYTAPASVPAGIVTLTATSVADSSKSAAATITVTAPPAIVVNVSPTTASVPSGGATKTFIATLQNDSQNQGVNWTLSGAGCNGSSCGTVSPASTTSGEVVTYTSPAIGPTAPTVTLTATSAASSTVSATASITVTAPPTPTPSSPLLVGKADVTSGYGLPVVATDSAGNIDLAWVNGGGPEFVRSTDGGSTFSTAITIPSNLGNTLLSDNDIQIALDSTGSISLLWRVELTPSSTSPTYFFSRSTDGGTTFSTPVNLSTTPVRTAQLVVQPNGTIVVAWFDSATSNLVAVHSTDGVHFSSPTTVWTAVGNPMDLTAVVSPQGQIYVFWTQLITNQNCSILFSHSADATTFSAAGSISGNSGACNQVPSAFVDFSGNVNVAWDADGTSLFFSRSTNSGATFSPPASVPTSAKPVSQQIAVGPEGTIYIVWETQTAVLFSHSVDGGATFSSSPTALSLVGGASSPLVAVDACNNISVVGQGGTSINILFLRSTDSGVTFAAPVALSNLNFDYYPELALDKNGNVNVTWEVDGPPDILYVRIPTTCSF